MILSALAICKAKRWIMVPLIIVAQFIGGVFGHATFYYLINGTQYDKDAKLAFCFGIIFPSEEISNDRCFVSSIIFTALLIMALLPVFAPELGGSIMNHSSSSLMVAILIFALVIASEPFGAQNNPTLWFTAYAFMWMNGFDDDIFKTHDNYWWVALVGPFVGVIVAIFMLIFFPLIMWYEPKDWKAGLKKMLE